MWHDMIIKNNGTFKVTIFKICCISWAPGIFHLWRPSLYRTKKLCISTNNSPMQNLPLLRLLQNVLITNGIWILLLFAAKSGENRVRIRKVNCTYLFFRSDEGQNRDNQLSLFLGSESVSITVTLVMWVSLVMLVRRPLGVMRRVDDPWSQNLSPPSSHPATQS